MCVCTHACAQAGQRVEGDRELDLPRKLTKSHPKLHKLWEIHEFACFGI